MTGIEPAPSSAATCHGYVAGAGTGGIITLVGFAIALGGLHFVCMTYRRQRPLPGLEEAVGAAVVQQPPAPDAYPALRYLASEPSTQS